MIAVVYGTRPEAIKLAPVIGELHNRKVPTTVVCTGQHASLLDAMPLLADHDLALMQPGQHPGEFLPRCLTALHKLWTELPPTRVVVQGDTATAFAAALAAFQLQIPIAHVEAGLRSYDLTAPFPEEGYRQMIDRLADRLYAATNHAQENLEAEGARSDRIVVTGNTGIDAAMAAAERGGTNYMRGEGPYVLVTLHRREAFGEPMRRVCKAIRKLAGTAIFMHGSLRTDERTGLLRGRPDHLRFVLPMHPNPAARAIIVEELSDNLYVSLIEPLMYDDLIATLRGAWCALTDSGGIQEEAPAFGVPVLVARETTERPEGIAAGSTRLVGLDDARIVQAIHDLRENSHLYLEMARPRFVYGDGHAAERIADDLESLHPG